MKRTLVARGLCKEYKGRQVVQGVDLDVASGEVIGLLGPNGAGKTTSFYMVVGLVRPDAGQVFLDELELTAMPMYQRARAGDFLSAAGALGFPQADGRGESAGDPGNA